MFKYISIVVLALLVSSCDDATNVVKFDNDRDRKDYQLIQSIKDRDCDKIFTSMSTTKTDFFSYDSILKAYFLEEGICEEVDVERAVLTYLNLDLVIPKDYFVNARLGNIYYLGKDVQKDVEKANYYFKQAILEVAPTIWMLKEGNAPNQSPLNTNSPELQVWGMTRYQLETIFTIEDIGPWKLPQPLLEQIHWVESIYEGDGRKILEIAHHLHDGTGGYEQNIEFATGWLAAVVDKNNNQVHLDLLFKWINELPSN